MFCKKFQTFSTRNLAGQLHILQSLTNVVKNFFLTFSTEVTNRFPTPLAHRQQQLQTYGRPWPRSLIAFPAAKQAVLPANPWPPVAS
jgi:hypothetical protein